MTEANAVRVLVVSGKPLCIVADDFDPPMMADSEIVEFRRVRGAAMKRGKSAQDVRTPRAFLDAVESRFGVIFFDLAASPGSSVVVGDEANDLSWGPERDSLKQDWTQLKQLCWLNPPFDPILPWVRKCAESTVHKSIDLEIALLCPLAVGTKWWRTYVTPFATVYSIGRITFVGSTDPFPKDLALCIYSYNLPEHPGLITHWDWAPKKVRGSKARVAEAAE
jgi:hypothetical protein